MKTGVEKLKSLGESEQLLFIEVLENSSKQLAAMMMDLNIPNYINHSFELGGESFKLVIERNNKKK